MKKTTTTLTALAAALALSACGSAEGEPATKTVTSSTKNNAPAPSPTTPNPSTPDVPDTTLSFGQTFEWEDGVKVTITEPTAYQPTAWSIGGEGYAHIVSVDVTVKNDSDIVQDVSYVVPTMTSGDRAGDEIMDDTVGFGSESALLPGRSVTFKSAYGVDDPSDVVVEFAPTWGHEYAYWLADDGEEV